MRPIHVIPALGAVAAAGALAATAGAQSSVVGTKASNEEQADLVAKAVAKEAKSTKATTLLSKRSFEVEADDISAGEYTIRVKRKGTGPTVLSDTVEIEGGSFNSFEAEPELTKSGRSYLKKLRKRSNTKLTFQVQVSFEPSDGGSDVKVTEDYSQRIKG